MPIIGKIALHLRYLCAKRLFARCDGFVNLEHILAMVRNFLSVRMSELVRILFVIVVL